MSFTTIILLAVIAYFIWAQFKTAKIQRTNALLIAHYLRTIFLLLDEFKGNEQDLRKQILRGYVYEHENTPVQDFNEPWEALAKACKVTPTYDGYGGYKVVDKKTIDLITSMIYTNVHHMEDITKKLPRDLSVRDLEKRIEHGE